MTLGDYYLLNADLKDANSIIDIYVNGKDETILGDHVISASYFDILRMGLTDVEVIRFSGTRVCLGQPRKVKDRAFEFILKDIDTEEMDKFFRILEGLKNEKN